MLGFFVTPYQDELLYSIFARYHQRAGNPTIKGTELDLCGDIDTPLNAGGFSFRLNDFIAQLPPNHNYTVEQLIREHTVIPYYTPFMSFTEVRELFDWIAQGKKDAFLEVRRKILWLQYSVKNLLFCPLCVEEDIKIYGEAYWHRTHHLPKVLVCYKHEVFLVDTDIPVRAKDRRNSLVTARKAVYPCTPQFLDTENKDHLTCTRKITPEGWRESTNIKTGDSSDEKDFYGRANRRHLARI